MHICNLFILIEFYRDLAPPSQAEEVPKESSEKLLLDVDDLLLEAPASGGVSGTTKINIGGKT